MADDVRPKQIFNFLTIMQLVFSSNCYDAFVFLYLAEMRLHSAALEGNAVRLSPR